MFVKMIENNFDIENIAKLQALFNSLVAGMIILDGNGRVESLNTTLAALLGYTHGAIEGKLINEFLDADNSAKFNKYKQEVVNENGSDNPIQPLQLWLKGKSEASSIKLSLSFSYVDSDLYFVGISTDSSIDNKLQLKLQNQLRSSRFFKEKFENEEALKEMLNRAVSIASHELHTPVSGIITSINLMQRYIIDKQDDWNNFPHHELIEKHIALLNESVRKMREMIGELLSLGNIYSGETNMYKNKFSLNDFLHDHKSFVKSMVAPQRELEYRVTNDDQHVNLDKNLLLSILNNVVSNAIKYSDVGSRIKVDATVEDEKLNITIEDQGRGIPEADQKKIFNHFYRAGNTGGESGTGLGLSIAKSYTRMLGGEINFESADGKGTTFYISIPLQ